MTPAQRDGLFLALIEEALSDLERRLASLDLAAFLRDRDEQALTAFRLSIIGENARKLSDDLKARHPHLPWTGMYAFRNIVAHAYHQMDALQAWRAIEALGPVRVMVRLELSGLPPTAP